MRSDAGATVERARRPSRATRPAGVGVEWLIDNADGYDALLAAIRAARRSVWISQLAFDVDCVAYRRGASDDIAEACDDGETLAAVLLEAAERRVQVRVLLNASVLLDTAAPFRRFLAASRADGVDTRLVRVRGVRRLPHVLHAKMAIIDGRDAFLFGSPFVNGYWDDPRHPPVDPRRPAWEHGGRPIHDVSVRLAGPPVREPVRELARIFAELWNDVAVDPGDGDVLHPPAAPTRAATHSAARTSVRVARTAPRRVLPRQPDGATQILNEVLAGVARAREYIYLEQQYVTARPVVDALAAALAREPALEVILVLNQNPDITAYRQWQNARLAESGLLGHPRVGVFSLWSGARRAGPLGPLSVNQLFVHSKVVLVDDRWATVGTANMEGVGLHSYGDDFTMPLARRVFRRACSFDVNVVLDAGDGPDDGAADNVAGRVRDLRTRLWCEHLTGSRGDPRALEAPPPGGWLAHWRDRAARNVAALNGACDGDPVACESSFVLPYSVRPTPAGQLAAAGVRTVGGDVALCYTPGWWDARAGLGWVRNVLR